MQYVAPALVERRFRTETTLEAAQEATPCQGVTFSVAIPEARSIRFGAALARPAARTKHATRMTRIAKCKVSDERGGIINRGY